MTMDGHVTGSCFRHWFVRPLVVAHSAVNRATDGAQPRQRCQFQLMSGDRLDHRRGHGQDADRKQPERTAMARVPYLEKTDLAEADQDLLSRPISLFKALVNSPKAARAFSGVGGFIRYGSKLDARLRELAILQVGWLARSPYEWSHHVKIGHDFGVSDADIQALIDDTAGKPSTLDALSLGVLKATREIAEGGAMTD